MIQPNQENKTYGIKSHLGFLRQHVTFHFPESPDFEKNQPKKCIYIHTPKFNGSPWKVPIFKGKGSL